MTNILINVLALKFTSEWTQWPDLLHKQMLLFYYNKLTKEEEPKEDGYCEEIGGKIVRRSGARFFIMYR